MHIRNIAVVVALLALLPPGAALAQPGAGASSGGRCKARAAGEGGSEVRSLLDMPLEELLELPVAVASTKEASVFTTPSTVTVIDRRTLELYNFQTVAEAVNTVAGFAVVRSSTRTDIPTSRWVLQEHYANKVLLMIDGVPSWSAVTGEATLGRIGIHEVERIEVLRGPSSVLYGTNAYTGAVNILLRCPGEAQGFSGSAHAGVATLDGVRGGGRIAVTEGALQLMVGADGFNEYGDMRQVTDAEGVTGWYRDFRNWSNVVLSASYERHALLLNAYREDRTKLGKDPTFAEGWGEPEHLDGYLANYTFTTHTQGGIGLRAGATVDWDRRVFSREDGYDLRTNTAGWRAVGFANALVPLGEWGTLEVGADIGRRTSAEYRNLREQTNETVAENNMRDRAVTELSAYAQLGAELQKLSLLGGARFTRNELFGNNVSARATGVYAFTPSNSAKLILGQSYRAPSLFEVYFIAPERSPSGNPALEPERSTSVELAYLTSPLPGLFLQALAYHAVYEGKIFRAPVPAGTPLADGIPSTRQRTSMYLNAAPFRANGVELELKYQLHALSSFASYTYVRGTKGDLHPASDHYNFKYVPTHKLVGGVALGMDGASASLVGTYLSAMGAPVADATGSDVIAPQLKVDLNLGYAHTLAGKPLRHMVSVKNLTDQQTVFPDYVDRDLKAIPYDQTRRLSYTLAVDF